MLTVRELTDRTEAEARLRSRDAEALLILPPDFSSVLLDGSAAATTAVTYVGDLTNPYYPIALTLSGAVIDGYVRATLGLPSPMTFEEVALGDTAARSEFEIYVPGLLIFAVIMMIFLSSMLITREVEAGTLTRLAVTRLSTFELLAGITCALLIVGMIEAWLTLAVAAAFGFRTQGSLWIVLLVILLTSFSIIGVGLVTASFARSVTQAFLLANFPLGIFMFFSGAVFPFPRVELFRLAGHSVGLYDILPPTHAVQAVNRVLNMGAGLGDIAFELIALTVLSIAYFFIGVCLFRKYQIGVQACPISR
jgi:ABC-2 type transport system permease protein